MGPYLRSNLCVEQAMAQRVKYVLADQNPHLGGLIYYNMDVIIHSIETPDNDLASCSLEWQIVSDDGTLLYGPKFCVVDLYLSFEYDNSIINTDNASMIDNQAGDEPYDPYL